MLNSAWHPDVHDAFMSARADSAKVFPSPADWRDHWIYFLLLDRFNNPDAPPRSLPWDSAQNTFQGGTFKGVAAQLDYLKSLAVPQTLIVGNSLIRKMNISLFGLELRQTNS